MISVKELLSFTPKNEKDYFPLFRWQIGRKLAYTILFGVLFVCLVIFLLMNPGSMFKNIRSYPVFSYHSMLLKFYKGMAGIRAFDGHIAYEGKVGKGKANGKGTLYDDKGNVLYEGGFTDNLYQGKGILYYPGAAKKYEGGFRKGLMQGKGKLYDENAALIYKGNFNYGEVAYEEMAGGPTSGIADKYKGKTMIYTFEGEMAAAMPGIDAVYLAAGPGDSLDDKWQVEGIYVLKPICQVGRQKLQTKSEIKSCFGKPIYQGTTAVHFGDAVALNQLLGKDFKGPEIHKKEELKDVYEVSGFEEDYQIYISVYEKNGLRYTFFSKDKKSREIFQFYMIEKVKT